MESWLEKLKQSWEDQGLSTQISSLDQQVLAQFEGRYSVTLPLPMRRYFGLLGGLTRWRDSDFEERGFRFLPLSEVTSVREFSAHMGWGVGDHRLSSSTSFVFVDYFQWSCAYAFEITSDLHTPIYLLGYPEPEKVADSFIHFVQLYLDQSPLLYKQ